jgi:predicted ATPase/DNA-binding winged helix-turn-helix (wHTH) protein
LASRNGSGLVQAEAAPEAFSFGPFRVVPSARLLERDGAAISLGSRAFDLLCLLIGRAGEVVSKGELMAKAWPGLTVDESSLRFHIAQLRRILGDDKAGESYVTNFPGRGYCFVAPVDRVESSPKRAQSREPASGRDATQNSAKQSPAKQNLPPKPVRIIGRDGAIRSLVDQLAARRFVTLRGPGGIGKTTVAVALAHELATNFRDGVLFLDLGSLKDQHLVAVAVASGLGLLIPVGDPTSRLIEALRDRELLLVLDGCEHVVEAVARLVDEIYRHAPAVSIIATSRESLEAASEFVVELVPLDIPPDDLRERGQIEQYSSSRLFMECAVAAGWGETLTDADAETMARICRKLDGVPLAIELVASRLSVHSLIEIDELIEGRLRLAWRGRRTAPLRHQSLSAALDWSYELIAPAERTLLEHLSVFPGAFALQGAYAVAGDLDGAEAVLGALEQLVAKSLVTSRPRSAQAQFRLLETTRAYAAEKLVASGTSRAANLRHARYVLQALAPRSYEPGGERPGGWVHRAELLPDARAALEWTFSDAGDFELRTPLAAACARLFVELNLLEECRVWAGRALAAAEDARADRGGTVELLWAFGHAAMFTERNSQQCESTLRRGLALAQEVGDLQNQFRLLSRLHALYRRTAERKHLLEVALLADAVAIKIGDPAAMARAHTYLGIAYHLNGDQRLARKRLHAGEVGDSAIPLLPVDHFAYPRGTHIMSCTNLWLLGLPDQAVQVANGLMDIGSNPDLAMYCAGVCFAARVYRWVGDMNALSEAAERLADHSRKHGFGPFYTASVALKGELQVALGAVDEGTELLRTSVPRMIADRLELYGGAATIALVEGLAAQGRSAEALASLQARIDVVTAQGDSWEMPELLRVRGELRSRSGDHSIAERDFVAAMELAERQSALSWCLRIATSRARLAKGANTRAAAVSGLRLTYARFSEGLDTADLRSARDLLRERNSADLDHGCCH